LIDFIVYSYKFDIAIITKISLSNNSPKREIDFREFKK